MNDRIHWFSVEGRPFCEKGNVRFQKYPDSRRQRPECLMLHCTCNQYNKLCYDKIHFHSFSFALGFFPLVSCFLVFFLFFLLILVLIFLFWFFLILVNVFGTLVSGLLRILTNN